VSNTAVKMITTEAETDASRVDTAMTMIHMAETKEATKEATAAVSSRADTVEETVMVNNKEDTAAAKEADMAKRVVANTISKAATATAVDREVRSSNLDSICIFADLYQAVTAARATTATPPVPAMVEAVLTEAPATICLEPCTTLNSTPATLATRACSRTLSRLCRADKVDIIKAVTLMKMKQSDNTSRCMVEAAVASKPARAQWVEQQRCKR